MLINDNIIFDRYYCINSAETKEIMVHYILQPYHILNTRKSFRFYAHSRRTTILIYSKCLAWRLVSSISKTVLTVRARVNCNINAWLSLHQYTAWESKVDIQCTLNERIRFSPQYGTCFMKIGCKLRKLCWFEYSSMRRPSWIFMRLYDVIKP